MCQIDSITPGEDGVDAHFGDTIVLTGSFSVAPGQATLLSADQPPASLTVSLWTLSGVVVTLPDMPSAAPHQLQVNDGTPCMRDISIVSIGSALDALLAQVTLTVPETIFGLGETVHAVLENLPGTAAAAVGTMSSAAVSTARRRLGRMVQPGIAGPASDAGTAAALPDGVTVEWEVLANGQPLPPGNKYIDSHGAAADILTAPPFEELRRPEPSNYPVPVGMMPIAREILARVTLSAPAPVEGIVSRTRDVKALVRMWPLRVPRVAALFEDGYYGSHLFLMVPEHSVYDSEAEILRDLPDLLGRVSAVREKLERLTSLTAFLIGIDVLDKELRKSRRVVLRRADAVSSLHAVIWDKVYTTEAAGLGGLGNYGDWEPTDRDVRVENAISSLIFLGLHGSRIHCFSQKDYNGRRLEVRIDTPVAVALIATLHVPQPLSATPGVTVEADPSGSGHFGNTFNSVQYV